MKQKHNFQMKLPPHNRGRNAAWLKTGLKIIGAGCIAIVILSVFCIVYYRSSLYVRSETGVTDIVAEPYSTYCYAIEGFVYGKMNNEGFQNRYDYNGQEINILMAGTSQIEGFQVPQNKTAASLFNDYCKNHEALYNIAKGGNSFDIQCKNFERALKYYTPQKYVVIETGVIQFSLKVIKKILANNVTSDFRGFNFAGFDITKIRALLAILWVEA